MGIAYRITRLTLPPHRAHAVHLSKSPNSKSEKIDVHHYPWREGYSRFEAGIAGLPCLSRPLQIYNLDCQLDFMISKQILHISFTLFRVSRQYPALQVKSWVLIIQELIFIRMMLLLKSLLSASSWRRSCIFKYLVLDRAILFSLLLYCSWIWASKVKWHWMHREDACHGHGVNYWSYVKEISASKVLRAHGNMPTNLEHSFQMPCLLFKM